jgi:hypothetical protein
MTKSTDTRSNERRYTNDYLVVFDSETDNPIGRILNLSETGLKMITDEKIKVGLLKNVCLKLPDYIEGCRVIQVDIECRWCEFNQRSDWYECGFTLENLTDFNLGIIRSLLFEWMNSSAGFKRIKLK